jgi:ATP-binding cassette subfamily B protein
MKPKTLCSENSLGKTAFQEFLPYLRPCWKEALLAPLLMVVEVICDLMQPRLLARMVDVGIVKGDVHLIFRTGILMVGIALLGMLGGVGCTVFASRASQGFGTDLRSAVFRKVQSFSFSSLDRFAPPTLITRITNDITQLQNLVLMALRIMVRAPLLFVGGIVMAIAINYRIAPVLLVAVAIELAVFFYLLRRGLPLFALVQQKIDRINTIIRENLAGIRLVKIFVRSSWEKSRFDSANQELMKATVQAFLPIITLMPLIMLVMNLSIVAVLWFGGLLVQRGAIQVGEVMALTNYVTQILFSLMMIGHIFIFVSRAGASANRVQEVLQEPVDIANPPHPDTKPIKEGEVVFESVSFSYAGREGEPVLRNISFSVRPGEMVAIVGTTGSGKSTLVHLIPRFYDVTGGRVLVDGEDVRKKDLKTLRAAIGMALQEPVLFSGTIRENICWGRPDASFEEIMEAAKIAQAHDFIMSFPKGYDTPLGQRGVNLSGGQKQRIAIARAIVKNPAILILDDGTSAVDLVTEQLILEGLKKRSKKCATFLITQRIYTVMSADRILVLDRGELVAQGTHQELLNTCSIYREMYELQEREAKGVGV